MEEDHSTWEVFRSALVDAASEVLPKARRKNNKGITNEILDLIEERRNSKGRESRKYKELNDVIKSKCKEAKDEF